MSHLTYEQRYTIAVMLSSDYSQKSIAEALGRDKSVISREIKRNRDGRSGEYRADLAARKCKERHQKKRKYIKLKDFEEKLIKELLAEKYSPEQITEHLRLMGVSTLSHERIYQLVWQDKKRGGTLYTHLRNRGKRYRKRGDQKDKRGQIPNRVSIAQRPEIVDRRGRVGDLEVDTIIGKNHKKAIVTINDRCTGMMKMAKVENKTGTAVGDKIIQMLLPWKGLIHTITSDNGTEFSEHQKIAKALGVDFFFADPYKSWQRGSNENLNGLVRQYIPKSSDLDLYDDQFIKFVQDQLNDRPRKRLGFLSPSLIFNSKVAFIN